MMHTLTPDRRKRCRSTLLVGVLLVALTLLIRPYVWIRVPGAAISFDGKPSSMAALYCSYSGPLLVWIREPEGGAPYLVYPSEGDVLLGHCGSILNGGDYLVTAPAAFIRPDAFLNGRLRAMALGSADLDPDPRLVSRPALKCSKGRSKSAHQ